MPKYKIDQTVWGVNKKDLMAFKGSVLKHRASQTTKRDFYDIKSSPTIHCHVSEDLLSDSEDGVIDLLYGIIYDKISKHKQEIERLTDILIAV